MEKSNEKALKIVEQQYGHFINSINWDFFRGLADYVKTLQELPATKQIVADLAKHEQVAKQLIEQMNIGAFKELTKSAESILKITEDLTKTHEKYTPIVQTIDEIKGQLSGQLRTLDQLEYMNNNLLDVAIQVKALGFSEAIKQFENATKVAKNIYGNYTFSPTYEKLESEKRTLKRREDTEPWGAWQLLPMVERVVLEPDELNNEVRKDLKEYYKNRKIRRYILDEFEDLRVQEMNGIRSGKIDAKEAIFFKLPDFVNYAKRVHIYVTTELLKTDTQTELSFDDTKSILSFADETIVIAKNAQSAAHDLLRTLFKDRSKTWNTDEVLSDWNHYLDDEKIPKNKVYQAGKAVNRIVAQNTDTKDFLIVTTKAVLINKKYLAP